MEKVFGSAEKFYNTIKEYVQTRIDEVKLNAAEKSSDIIANILTAVIVSAVMLLFIIFLGIAVSIGIGNWIGKAWAGFLIVAFFYFIIGIIIWKGREKLIRFPIMNALIQQLFKNNNENKQP